MVVNKITTELLKPQTNNGWPNLQTKPKNTCSLITACHFHYANVMRNNPICSFHSFAQRQTITLQFLKTLFLPNSTRIREREREREWFRSDSILQTCSHFAEAEETTLVSCLKNSPISRILIWPWVELDSMLDVKVSLIGNGSNCDSPVGRSQSE